MLDTIPSEEAEYIYSFVIMCTLKYINIYMYIFNICTFFLYGNDICAKSYL